MTRAASGLGEGPRGSRRVLPAVLGLPVLLGLVLVLWAPELGLDQRPFLAQLTAFRVQVACAVLALGAAVLLLRRRAARVFGGALMLVALSPLPQILPRVVPDGVAGAGDLTVVSVNVQLDLTDPSQVAGLALTRGADVVALPEASAAFAAEVVRIAAAAGTDYVAATDGRQPPAVAGTEREGPYPTSLLVRADRRPVFRAGVPDTRLGGVTAELGGPRPVSVAAVHASAPVPGREPLWAADHEVLAAACAAGGPLVLAGDLNSTLDHSPLRAVLAAGCADAAEVTGQGLRGTWPADSARPLRVPIDHVLLTPSAGTVVGFDVVDVPGTDHRGLVVTIAGPA